MGHFPSNTALLVEVPQAEPLVGPWRMRFDPAGRAGVPAHVTVLFPFRAPDTIDDQVLEQVAAVAASVPAFEVKFAEPATWPGTVWLRPEPDDGLRRLMAAAFERFPDCPPYDGAFDDMVPHLTVGQDLDDEQQREIVAAMVDGLRDGPIKLVVEELALFASHDDGEWERTGAWPLG